MDDDFLPGDLQLGVSKVLLDYDQLSVKVGRRSKTWTVNSEVRGWRTGAVQIMWMSGLIMEKNSTWLMSNG